MTASPDPVDKPRPFGRRTVLKGGAAAAAAAAVSVSGAAAAARNPFRHGVASGDPLPTAVVLWTRVSPTSAATPGSGRGPRVRVTWEVAKDARFRTVVRRGSVSTGPARDHTVKVDARGLRPDTAYHYRFTFRGKHSPVGRTRTAPRRNAAVENLRLGVVSCANLQAGWFSSYRHLAQRNDLHAILHLGDYLYEYGPGEYGYGIKDVDVRPHSPAHETITLADYRMRHAQYKRDPDLQRLHARHPFIVTWDDHETANDAWRSGAENHGDGEGSWARRRRAATRAYDEWMPVRMGGTAAPGDGTRLHRRFRFGTLAELSMLDLRSYRSLQADNPLGGAVSSPDRTITGGPQMGWLKRFLTGSGAQWKLIGNPVMIAPVTFAALPDDLWEPVNDTTGLLPNDGIAYNVDQWDGYTADRRELFDHIRDHGVTDTVFVTGDIHSAWANDLPFDKATYPVVKRSAGVEFVCTSVTSNNLKDILGARPRTASLAVEAVLQTANRHVRYLNFDDHGYSILDVTPERTQMDYYVIGDRTVRNAATNWSTSWRTDAGTQLVRPAAKPVTDR